MNRPSFAGMGFDLVVVGGGIMGACVARDTARRGLTVALIERGDFSGATSAASSKLVHGGLRYLQNLELRIVRESLKERRVWAHIAPHLVHPLPFLMPFLGGGVAAKLKLGLGFGLYDALAFDRNRLADPSKHVPRHAGLGKREAEALEPALAGTPFTRAMRYFDYQMESPERLGLECILDAVAAGAVAANYVELTGFLRSRDGAVEGIAARDLLSNSETEIRGRFVVNATGVWADRLLRQMLAGEPPFEIRPSKGIHLVCRPLLGMHALALMGEGEHLFALPWRGLTVVGTTDTGYDGPLEDVRATEADRRALIERCNRMLPAARLAEEDVRFAYAGLRPLVSHGGDSGNTYDASRAAEIVEHARHGGPASLMSVIGGKWTTSRLVAEQAVDRLARTLGVSTRSCDTAEARLPLAPDGSFPEFEAAMTARLTAAPAGARSQLCRNYGRRADAVVDAAGGDMRLLEPLTEGFPHIGAEIVHAVREEMAVTLEDVLFRRTALAPMGGATAAAIRRAADIMAVERGWDAAAKKAQIAAVERRLARS
jgi:glycerol-3-phosphate dehydrogenase